MTTTRNKVKKAPTRTRSSVRDLAPAEAETAADDGTDVRDRPAHREHEEQRDHRRDNQAHRYGERERDAGPWQQTDECPPQPGTSSVEVLTSAGPSSSSGRFRGALQHELPSRRLVLSVYSQLIYARPSGIDQSLVGTVTEP